MAGRKAAQGDAGGVIGGIVLVQNDDIDPVGMAVVPGRPNGGFRNVVAGGRDRSIAELGTGPVVIEVHIESRGQVLIPRPHVPKAGQARAIPPKGSQRVRLRDSPRDIASPAIVILAESDLSARIILADRRLQPRKQRHGAVGHATGDPVVFGKGGVPHFARQLHPGSGRVLADVGVIDPVSGGVGSLRINVRVQVMQEPSAGAVGSLLELGEVIVEEGHPISIVIRTVGARVRGAAPD